MSNSYFQFKQFRIEQGNSGMKVTTDACLFGAWVAKSIGKPPTALDIGTGTGLLTCMLAQVIPNSRIDAIEIDTSAFKQAVHNTTSSPWNKMITCFNKSLQEFSPPSQYSLIVSNPPFFNTNPKGNSEQKNKAIHDDHLPMKDLCQGIANNLAYEGQAFILYPPNEMRTFIELAEKHGIHLNEQLDIRDKPSTPLIRTIGKFSRKRSKIITSEMSIKNEIGDYTRAFQSLLGPYYLHL